MTVPGETDRAPIKIVPIYLDPVEEPVTPYAETPASAEPDPTPDAPRRASGLVGGLALLVAMAAAILTAVGVAVASSGAYDAGTALGWAAVAASGVAVAGGLIASVFGLGRATGIAAVIIGVIANPWLLTNLLSLVVPA